MSKNDTCEYCDGNELRRREYKECFESAWVNVEYKSLDVSVYDHAGFIHITHCPWCGREL